MQKYLSGAPLLLQVYMVEGINTLKPLLQVYLFEGINTLKLLLQVYIFEGINTLKLLLEGYMFDIYVFRDKQPEAPLLQVFFQVIKQYLSKILEYILDSGPV